MITRLNSTICTGLGLTVLGFLYEPLLYGVWPKASTVHGMSPKESRASILTKDTTYEYVLYNHVVYLHFLSFPMIPVIRFLYKPLLYGVWLMASTATYEP